MPAAATPRSSPSNNEHALHSSLLDMYPHRLHVSAVREPENEAPMISTLTLRFLCGLHLFFYRERFPGVDDVDYRAWPGGFEVLQERPGVTAVGVGGVYAFGGEIVELLEIGIPVYGWLGKRSKSLGEWTYITISFS